jgi:hypothetical protein
VDSNPSKVVIASLKLDNDYKRSLKRQSSLSKLGKEKGKYKEETIEMMKA